MKTYRRAGPGHFPVQLLDPRLKGTLSLAPPQLRVRRPHPCPKKAPDSIPPRGSEAAPECTALPVPRGAQAADADWTGSPEGVRRISRGPQDPPTSPTGKPLVRWTLPTGPTCPTLRSQGAAQNPAYRPARPLSPMSGYWWVTAAATMPSRAGAPQGGVDGRRRVGAGVVRLSCFRGYGGQSGPQIR